MRKPSRAPRTVLGLLLLSVGAVLLLGRLGLFHVELRLVDLWPLIFVVLGVGRLLGREWGGALLFLALGGAFLAPKLDPDIHLRDILAQWPFFLVAIGVYLVARSLLGDGGKREARASSGSGVAILRNARLVDDSKDYRGEDLTAILSSCELDLSSAELSPTGARIEVFAFWGGIEIQVPEDWAVEIRAFTLMGGSEQKSRNNQTLAPDGPRLEIRGVVVMGGLEVRN